MTKYLMCTYSGQICIFMPNMGVLWLNLWPGGACTDNDNYNDKTNEDTEPTTDQAWLHKVLWLINQMSQKVHAISKRIVTIPVKSWWIPILCWECILFRYIVSSLLWVVSQVLLSLHGQTLVPILTFRFIIKTCKVCFCTDYLKHSLVFRYNS